MSLLCLSGRYDQLYTYATFAVILAYTATGIALLRRSGAACRTCRAPTAAGAIPSSRSSSSSSSAALAVNTIREQPQETLAGLAILLLGRPGLLLAAAARGRRGRSR